jgi:hypothetical protein
MLSNANEIDPWWVSNFFRPLEDVQEASETLTHYQSPPQDYVEARSFAVRLWECCDTEDVKALVSASIWRFSILLFD